MVKRKVTAGAGAGGLRRSKRTKTTTTTLGTFIWNPNDWLLKRAITEEVSLLVSRANTEQLLIKKLLRIDSDQEDVVQPREIRVLSLLSDCNRIVKPIFYGHKDPDLEHGTALFQHYPLGDLIDWKERRFDAKNRIRVPESFIWRCFLQISEALAFIQGKIGLDLDPDQRGCIIHRDIKPDNILVVDNGTKFPSFKLHDFGCAMVWQKSKARKPACCGTRAWQPPENHTIGINTRAADVWSLGACIYYLATGKAPIEDIDAYGKRFNVHNPLPASAAEYGEDTPKYYDARVPRGVIPLNLAEDQLHERGLGLSIEEKRAQGIGPEYHQYSDELNDWMTQCLNRNPSKRPTTERLVDGMNIVAKDMLRRIGGKTALVDLDVKFGVDA